MGFSVLMFVFSFFIFIAGLYIFTGHNSELLLWKTYKKNTPINELRNIGKWTMVSSIIPFCLAIYCLFFIK